MIMPFPVILSFFFFCPRRRNYNAGAWIPAGMGFHFISSRCRTRGNSWMKHEHLKLNSQPPLLHFLPLHFRSFIVHGCNWWNYPMKSRKFPPESLFPPPPPLLLSWGPFPRRIDPPISLPLPLPVSSPPQHDTAAIGGPIINQNWISESHQLIPPVSRRVSAPRCWNNDSIDNNSSWSIQL